MPQAGSDWMMPVIQLGSFGVLAWLVLYLFRVSIPKTQENFQKFSDEQRTDFLAALKDQRTDFRASLTELSNNNAKVSESVDELTEAVRQKG